MPAETTVAETGSILPVVLVVIVLISFIVGIVYVIGQWDLGSYLETSSGNPLLITHFSVDPQTPIANSEATLSWRVKNTGLLSTGEYKVSLKIDGSSVWSNTFNEPISSGDYKQIDRKVTLPRGYHNITVEADLTEEKEGRKPEKFHTKVAWSSQQEAAVISLMISEVKSASDKLKGYKDNKWYDIYSKLLVAQANVYDMCIEAAMSNQISLNTLGTCYRGGGYDDRRITNAIGETVSKSSYDDFVNSHGDAFPGLSSCGASTVELRNELNILGTINSYCNRVVYKEKRTVSTRPGVKWVESGLIIDSVKVASQVEAYLVGVMKDLWSDSYGIPFVSQFS